MEDKEYLQIHKRRLSFLLKLYEEYVDPNSVVGDIGVSPFSCMILKKGNFRKFYSIIPDEEFKDASTPCLKRLEYILFDLTSQRANVKRMVGVEKFDVIFFSEVMEHIFQEDSVILENLNLLLQEEGLLILTVPNMASAWRRLKLLFGKNIVGTKTEIIHGVYGGYGHIREYTFKEVKRLLTSTGFEIVRLEGFNGYGGEGIKGATARAVLDILPKTYAFHIVCIAKKGAR